MAIQDKVDLQTAITANFADNTSRAISPEDLRTVTTDLLDSVHGVYGLMTVIANAVAQSITTTAARITAWSANGIAVGTTPDHATTNAIAVGTDGIYQVHFSADVILVAGTWTINIAVGTTLQATLQWAVVAAGTIETTISIVGLVTCVANDVISIYATSSSGGGLNLTLKNAQLTVHRIA